MPLPNISPELLKAYQEEISKRSSSATLKRKTASLSKFFNWAESQGHIQENPLQKNDQVYQVLQVNLKRNYKPLMALASLTLGIVAIILALKNIKLPIPSRQSSAQNKTVTQIPAQVQTPQILSTSGWTIFTKLNLKDSSGNPVITSQIITFQLYKDPDSKTPVWTGNLKQVQPDSQGNISISLDGVPSDVFFQNDKLFLSGTSQDINGNSQTLPSIPVSTANTASNLQGFAPASPEEGAVANTIPVISNDGSLILASESPAIKAKEGNLLIEGQAVTITAPPGSGGNITIAPSGETDILSNLKIQNANIKSGSLISGYVGNNLSNYDLINLSSGSKPTEKFSVDALGNTYIAGNATIAGQLGINNLSVNNITASGNITDIKKGTALSDLVTLTLDERNKPTDRNSIYSTLVLRRYDGAREAAALYVDEGNAIFDGQVQLGRFSSNPDAIGSGSIIYNSSDTTAYIWNGSSWVPIAGGTSSGFWQEIAGVLSPLTSTDTLSVNGLSVPSGTVSFPAGQIDNIELANSSITINSSGILSGGGTVSLGGTLNLTATEADTLASVTGRGATTTTAVNLNGGVTSTSPTITLSGLTSGTGTALCRDSFNNIVTCTTGSGGIAGSGTAGQITYFDSTSTITSEASGFAWDAANNRLGIGIDSPISKLHVTGAVTGKALVIFDETGDQDIFTASASGLPKFTISNSGNITATTGDVAITAGNLTLGGGTTRIANTGVGTFITGTVIGSQTFTTNNIADSGALIIKSNTTNALTLDSGTTGIVNLGTGTSGKTINIGTDNTNKDTINIGSALDDTIINGAGTGSLINFANFDVATTGNITVQGGYGIDTNAAGTLALGDITATTINIGTNATGRTIALGGTGANAITLGGGAGTLAIDTGDWDIGTTGDMTGIGGITMDGSFSQTGSETFGTGTGAISLNGDTTIAANKSLTFTAGTGSITANSTVSNVSKNVISIVPSYTGGATDSLTYTMLNIATFSPTNASGTDTVNGVEIGALTDPGATITSTALKIGSGWDNVLTVNGTAVINGTGQLVAGQLTGTLFTLAGDSGSGTIAQGNTLTVAGGTNGIDTVESGTTVTLNLATTEIGNATFGSGSALTWTFNASAGTDPTLAFGDNTTTIGSNLILADTKTLQVGGLTGTTYNAFANAGDTPAATANITADNDLFVGGNLELKGGLYLTGRNIFNNSIGAITFVADPAAMGSYNSLSYGSWLVQNSTNNGLAALMVNQGSTVADIFTASSSATLNATPGVTRFVINNAGNVGIGMTAPDAPLDIAGTAGNPSLSSSVGIIEITPSVGPNITFGAYATSPYAAWIQTKRKTNDGTTWPLVLNPLGGNVGIGKTSPLAKLDVYGELRISNTSGVGGDYDNYPVRIISYYNANSMKILSNINREVFGVYDYDKTVLGLSGNVGIGVSPSYKLDVAGTVHTTGDFLADGNYGLGLVGVYSSTVYQNVFAMGTAYRLPANGTTPGNLYGIAWTHTNVGGESKAGLGHQALFMANGVTQTAIGTGIWTNGNLTFAAANPTISASSYFTAPGGANFSSGTVYTTAAIQARGGIHNDSAAYLTISGGTSGYTYFSGKVGIGTTGPLSKLSVGGVGESNVAIYGTATDTAFYGSSPGWAAQLYGSGYLSAASWTYGSDRRSKENIQYYSDKNINALDIIDQLKPVSFDFINHNTGMNEDGFIAQDVQSVLPNLVTVDKNGILGLQTTNLIPYLVKGIQEQQTQIASLSGQLANLNLTDTGDLNIIKVNSTSEESPSGPPSEEKSYTLRTTAGEIITRIGAFAEVVAANIRAGAITTRQLATDGLTAFTATIDNLLINNGLVSPIVQTNLISPLADSSDVIIKIGKSATSGEPKLTPEESYGKLVIQDATGSAVTTFDSSGNVYTEGSISARSASVSGELYAEKITSPDLDKIQELLRQVKTDQDLLAQASTWSTNTVTDLYVTGQAAISSLSVSNSFAVGTDFVVQALGTSGLGNSINTLTAPLALQSLAMAPVEIMAGKIRIETNGDVKIQGNVEIAGNLNVKGTISGKEVTTEKLIIATSPTSEESPSTSLGTSVPTSEVKTGEITSNATAGKTVIPAGISEIVINNPQINDSSLIYVTPTSTTQNNVLYVKSKETGKFVVGFTSPIDIDVTFNWWVIEVQQ